MIYTAPTLGKNLGILWLEVNKSRLKAMP